MLYPKLLYSFKTQFTPLSSASYLSNGMMIV